MGSESNSDDKSLVLAWSPTVSVSLLDSVEGLAAKHRACSLAFFQARLIYRLGQVF